MTHLVLAWFACGFVCSSVWLFKLWWDDQDVMLGDMCILAGCTAAGFMVPCLVLGGYLCSLADSNLMSVTIIPGRKSLFKR